MKRRQFSHWLFAGGLGLAGSLFGSPSDARPGGGQTFRKGSSSSSSDSSSDSSSNSRDDDDDKPMFPERKSAPLFPEKTKSMFDDDKPSSFPSRSPSPSPSPYTGSPSTPSTPGPSRPYTPHLSSENESTSFLQVFVFGVFGVVGFGFIGVFGSIVKDSMIQVRKGWSSIPKVEPPLRPPPARPAPSHSKSCTSMEEAFMLLHAPDPNFSRTLFDDFLYSLYAETQVARGKGTLVALEPYLGKEVSRYGHGQLVREVRDVVIGAMKLSRIHVFVYPDGRRGVQIKVDFQVNYTEVDTNGQAQSYWIEETWTLERLAGVLSRSPEKTRMLGCPSCGAPLDRNMNAKCGYCGVVASPGVFDWTVCETNITTRESRGPMLTGTTQEVGTDLPTVMDQNVKEVYGALAQKDPSLGWTAFIARLDTIFQTFHEGWTARDLSIVRPYLTDNLLAMQQYWIETYRSQGLRNVSENPSIIAVHLARVRSDKFFDAITVRIYAMCLDYTVDNAGTVLGGDRTALRQYSEYWTLIRGAERRGQPRTDPVCPNCGAPNRKINMAGCCKSCNAHITSGEFDWVLSRIEQDEAYGDSIG